MLAVDRPGSNLAFPGLTVEALEADLARDESPCLIVRRARERFDGLDILFDNAGVSASVLASEMTDDAWDQIQAVNIRAVFRLCREARSSP